MKSARPVLLATAAALALTSCERTSPALGTATSIIVLATDSVWTAVGDSVLSALGPRIYTVRSERTFEVTQVSPADPDWQELREFRQIVAIGAPTDAWVQPIYSKAGLGDGADVAQPDLVTTRDVWARNQQAIAVAISDSDAAGEVLPHLDRVGSVIDSMFRV